jgi:hypothetical protein
MTRRLRPRRARAGMLATTCSRRFTAATACTTLLLQQPAGQRLHQCFAAACTSAFHGAMHAPVQRGKLQACRASQRMHVQHAWTSLACKCAGRASACMCCMHAPRWRAGRAGQAPRHRGLERSSCSARCAWRRLHALPAPRCALGAPAPSMPDGRSSRPPDPLGSRCAHNHRQRSDFLLPRLLAAAQCKQLRSPPLRRALITSLPACCCACTRRPLRHTPCRQQRVGVPEHQCWQLCFL